MSIKPITNCKQPNKKGKNKQKKMRQNTKINRPNFNDSGF